MGKCNSYANFIRYDHYNFSGHTVTITGNLTADQIVVNSGGTLVQNSVTLTLNNGTGTDLNVSGTFRNGGTVSINSSAVIAYQSGGKYQHNFLQVQEQFPLQPGTSIQHVK
ncbi:MAG: hypothetical protein IPF75_09295 [Bacteroidetes bacterium]|nr:hypothetical protein [Bacteroidota bacterium]